MRLGRQVKSLLEFPIDMEPQMFAEQAIRFQRLEFLELTP